MTSVKTVYILSQFVKLAKLLSKALPEVTIKRVELKESKENFVLNLKLMQDEVKKLQDAEILLADNDLAAQVLYKLPKLKWLQGTWNGVEAMNNEVIKNGSHPNYPVTRYSGPIVGQILAEYTIGQIINKERDFFYHFQNTKLKNKWEKNMFLEYRTINEITIAILGVYGTIGSQMARVLNNYGAKVIGFGRKKLDENDTKEIKIERYSNKLEDILPYCDFIVNVLPSTPTTNNLLNKKILHLCDQRKPVFINIGRGTIIDDKELIESLDNKYISAAILDVFREEPLPAWSPLWSHQNIFLTPHIAAYSRPNDVINLFIENYKNFTQGNQLKYTIDWNKGY